MYLKYISVFLAASHFRIAFHIFHMISLFLKLVDWNRTSHDVATKILMQMFSYILEHTSGASFWWEDSCFFKLDAVEKVLSQSLHLFSELWYLNMCVTNAFQLGFSIELVFWTPFPDIWTFRTFYNFLRMCFNMIGKTPPWCVVFFHHSTVFIKGGFRHDGEGEVNKKKLITD